MKILHVVESLNRGGLERVVIDLASLQHSKGHDIRILCIMEKGQLAKSLEKIGISVVCSEKPILGTFRALNVIRFLAKDFKPDVIHTHNPIPNYFVFFALFCFRNFHVVNTRHGMGQFWSSRKGKILYFLSQSKTRYIVAVCDTARDLFVQTKQVFKKKIKTIKNGICIEKFHKINGHSRRQLCAELGILTDSVLIGTVGRLNYVKNHEYLISTIAAILPNNSNVHLVIIGGGELMGELKHLIQSLDLSSRIHLLGDRGDVPALLSSMDIFVLSSVSEGFSMALLEACACSLPIIATDVGGNAEIITDNVNGIIVESNNVEQLSLAITKLIDNKDMCDELGAMACRWVSKEASTESMYSKYMQIYESR